MLDDGHITDSTGRVIDFKNTIIIMTSNAGAENIVSPKSLGFSSGMTEQQNHEEMKGKVMDEVKRIFKPEFINRIDDIVVFHVLGKEQIAQIVDIMIANVNKRIMEQMKLSIELDDAARQWLVDKGMILNMVQDHYAVQSRMRLKMFLRSGFLWEKSTLAIK